MRLSYGFTFCVFLWSVCPWSVSWLRFYWVVLLREWVTSSVILPYWNLLYQHKASYRSRKIFISCWDKKCSFFCIINTLFFQKRPITIPVFLLTLMLHHICPKFHHKSFPFRFIKWLPPQNALGGFIHLCMFCSFPLFPVRFIYQLIFIPMACIWNVLFHT